MVVFESVFSARTFGRKSEVLMLNSLQQVAAWSSLLFIALRYVDLAVRGRLELALRSDMYALLFWLETLLFLAPVTLLLVRKRRPAAIAGLHLSVDQADPRGGQRR